MNPPSSTREALIAEVIGDVAALLDRTEALVPALEASRLALLQASTRLADQLDGFDKRMGSITENAKQRVVEHIARRADEITRAAAQSHTRAMEEAARMLFTTEIGPALHRVSMPLQHLAALAHRGAHPWQYWLTHAATAVVASALTWALAAWLWAR